ncbi:hypothetical protein FCJ60_08545 [Burkholderia metallica]|nr:hypothetical protein [Burkholderia metallica]
MRAAAAAWRRPPQAEPATRAPRPHPLFPRPPPPPDDSIPKRFAGSHVAPRVRVSRDVFRNIAVRHAAR